jgi:inner membrane transporter RhtA
MDIVYMSAASQSAPPLCSKLGGLSVNRPLAAIAALLMAMVSIQTGASLAKSLFPLVGPQGSAALRLFFASFILLLAWRPWSRPPARSTWSAVWLYGLSLGGMNLLFYMSLAHIPLGIAVAFEFCGPLSVALFASRRAMDFLWVACAVGGIPLLLPLGGSSAALDPLGIVFALAAGACWALYIIFGRRVGAAVHGGTATALGMSVAALIVLPFGVTHSGLRLLSWDVLPTGIAVAVLSSAVPYSLEMVALKRLPAHTFGILMSMEPAVAALSGLIFLSEKLSVFQWVALGLIILASAGSTMSAKPAEPLAEMVS